MSGSWKPCSISTGCVRAVPPDPDSKNPHINSLCVLTHTRGYKNDPKYDPLFKPSIVACNREALQTHAGTCWKRVLINMFVRNVFIFIVLMWSFSLNLSFSFRYRKCGTGGYLLTSTSNREFASCVTVSSVPTNQHGQWNLTPPTSCRPLQWMAAGVFLFVCFFNI